MTDRRRSFLATLGAGLAAPAILRAQSRSKRYPIAFSTLGCPAWSWKTILENADRLGYAGARAARHRRARWTSRRSRSSRARASRRRRRTSPRSASWSPTSARPRGCTRRTRPTREKQLDEGRRFIDLAHAMGVKYVRMFGDKIPEGEPKEEVMKRVVDGFQQMAELREARRASRCSSSRTATSRTRPTSSSILTRVGSPQFALLWDAHHSFVAGKEQPGRHLRERSASGSATRTSRTRSPTGADRRYVLIGTGEVPVKEQVAVLAKDGYKGFYCFEWEKKWHPEIEEPEVAFPHYAKDDGRSTWPRPG